MAVRELGVGFDVTRVVMGIVVFTVLAALAIGAAIAALVVWLVVQLFAHLSTDSSSAPASDPSDTQGSPKPPLAANRWAILAAIASAGAGAMLWLGVETPFIWILGAAGAVLAVIALGSAGSTSRWNIAAIAVSFSLGAVVCILGLINSWNDAPQSITPTSTPAATGTATRIEDVWARVECLPGTTDPAAEPESLMFDDESVARVGSCIIDTDSDAKPVYFFEFADSAEATTWLMSGDLSADSDAADDVEIFVDGVVVIASLDSGSYLDLSNDGYEDIRLE